MTVLPQGERELLAAHERLKRRRARRFVGLRSRVGISGDGHPLSERGTETPGYGIPRSASRTGAGMVALAASVAVAVGVAAVILVSAQKMHSPTRAGSSTTGEHGGESGIDQTLIRNFKILRRPLGSSDRLPAPLAQMATAGAPINGDSSRASLGLVPKLAREVILPGTGLRAWLIPGRRGLCWDAEYAGQELGASCRSSQDLASALAGTNGIDSVRTRTGLITVGLVTDRVLGLESATASGQRTQIPIKDGFYAGYGISGKRLIALTANGPQTLPPTSSEIVFNAVGSPTTIPPSPDPGGTLLAQVNLQPPAGRPPPAGVAQIYNSTHGYFLSLTFIAGKRKVAHDSYAVWLYSSPHAARLLGFVTQRPGRGGTLTTAGVLPSNAGRYRELLVTLEHQTTPKTPGRIILSGPLRRIFTHKK